MKIVSLPAHADPIQQAQNQVPLCAKALAAEFGVSLSYIYSMRAAGAPFWGKFSTVAALMEWLRVNPIVRKKPTAPDVVTAKNIAASAKMRENARKCGITVL